MNCKICSSETVRIENCNNRTIYYNCINCDLIFIDENFIKIPEKEKLRYLKHNNTLDNNNYVKIFNTLIEEYIIPNQNKIEQILDFGCGPIPIFADLLKAKGFNVDIYDKYFFPLKDYQKKEYDLITLIEVIEHLKDPFTELIGLKNKLNKNGFIIIKTLFHPMNNDVFLKWWYKEDFTHISFFSKKTFKVLAEKLKLKIVSENKKDLCVFQKE
jgi:2-polyprenyl-3-methyl-5-hydroxy-6-metoxy-1,4-benzoquinol methylase